MTFDAESVELSISELSALLNTSKSALRYYEKEGLIKPERSDSSGYRRYSFQSLIELSDVMLYRGLNIPVKEVRTLLDSPIDQTSLKLDEAETELVGQLRQIADTLERVLARKRRIQQYQSMRDGERRFVEQPAIEQLFAFDVGKPEAMGAYLTNPESVRYAAFFPEASDSATYVDAAVRPCGTASQGPLWKRPRQKARWLECLMRTDYSLTDSNDLPTHLGFLEERGYAAGSAIAEYLTFDWDAALGRRFDYYRVWIEALDGPAI